jgi:DNA-binding MarR family transcriptional regulator
MVRLMDGLLADGLVSRDRDPGDRRRYRISLTPQGRKALTAARTVVREVEKTTLQPLSAAERATLHRLVMKIQQDSVK